jgi:broad specificity polyphosphatase/5'/3'-nucleotidase SurE
MQTLGKATILAPIETGQPRPCENNASPSAGEGNPAGRRAHGYASDGAPSDCVALAILGFIPEKVDLLFLG